MLYLTGERASVFVEALYNDTMVPYDTIDTSRKGVLHCNESFAVDTARTHEQLRFSALRPCYRRLNRSALGL